MTLKKVDTVIFDIHGTIHEDGKAVEGINETIETLRDRGYKIAFATNKDSVSDSDIYYDLIDAGIKAKREEVFSPVTILREFVKQNKNKTFYPIINTSVIESLEDLKTCKESPDYIIVGGVCENKHKENIEKAIKISQGGANLIALSRNTDYELYSKNKYRTGEIVKKLEDSSNKKAKTIGKQSKSFFDTVLNFIGSTSQSTIVVGDDLSTDIEGAKEAGAITVLVRTGKFKEESLNEAKNKPDYVVGNANGVVDLITI